MRQQPQYDKLLSSQRHRTSTVRGRTLEEEADADTGRILFSSPFRRLQNKAQVFALERNAAIRSRLTHSLEVSSIGRFVAQQAIGGLDPTQRTNLKISGHERPLITFVENACLLHDIGNPPFGHFGEEAISNWFHRSMGRLGPQNVASDANTLWNQYFTDFLHFDGNPQGFRIITKLQAKSSDDLTGMNLTATTLAATIKYPWPTTELVAKAGERRKKAGYFLTEEGIADWVWTEVGLERNERHPLVYLMEAADDIAYCLSDIEDGIEKGLIGSGDFAAELSPTVQAIASKAVGADSDELARMTAALKVLAEPRGRAVGTCHFSAMADFRGSVIRYLSRHAGVRFAAAQLGKVDAPDGPLLGQGPSRDLLNAVKSFAVENLFASPLVRDRELTAQAVIGGLLEAYATLMVCDRSRFLTALDTGTPEDGLGRRFTGERSLLCRLPPRYVAVYREEVRRSDEANQGAPGLCDVMERLHRIRLFVDYIACMTDEYAFQTYKLVSGMDTNRHGN